MRSIFYIQEEQDSIFPGMKNLARLVLSHQQYVYAYERSDDPKLNEQIIKEAKKLLINQLMEDLLNTKDWFDETSENRSE